MLPLHYVLRNLTRNPARFVQTIAGSALVVFLIIAAGSFNRGMDLVLRASGSPLNVILLGAGSEESVERSEISPRVETLATAGIPGIEQKLGQPAVSGEIHYMGSVLTAQGQSAQALLRGITPSAFNVHTEVRILDGHFPVSGEVLVGRLAHHTLGVPASHLEPGQTITFEDQPFTVSGYFDAPGTVMESEIWFNRNDLMTLTQRDTLSCVVVRLTREEAFADAELFASQRLDLELSALQESDYYASLSRFYGPIRNMTWLTAALIAAGAVFGGLNMLYAAFAARIQELATLQAIGYSRPALLLALIQESLIATLSGTLIAAYAAIVLLEGRTVNFSMGTFDLSVSAKVLLAGLIAGALLGSVGALPPALRCLGTPITRALRSS